MMKRIKPTSSSQYDAEQVARFFDAYGIREWNRLVLGPAQEVSLYIHTHYLEQFVKPGQRVLEIGAAPDVSRKSWRSLKFALS